MFAGPPALSYRPAIGRPRKRSGSSVLSYQEVLSVKYLTSDSAIGRWAFALPNVGGTLAPRLNSEMLYRRYIQLALSSCFLYQLRKGAWLHGALRSQASALNLFERIRERAFVL